jgi:hypothetical protein
MVLSLTLTSLPNIIANKNHLIMQMGVYEAIFELVAGPSQTGNRDQSAAGTG